GRRTDGEGPRVRGADASHLPHVLERDQYGRTLEPILHREQERLATRDHASVAVVLAERSCGLGRGGRPQVRERLHDPLLSAPVADPGQVCGPGASATSYG